MSDIPTFTMRQLLEAGVHFGHTTRRWNPKMESYLFGVRNGIHIIDLGQTVPMMHSALQALYDAAAAGGRILFVGTKRQARDLIKEYAGKCGQYYVNYRWLGGMMTNWQTVSNSIKRLKELDARLNDTEEMEGLTKRELLGLSRQREKLELALGGIKEMGSTPDILVVLDTVKDQIAVKEAQTMGLPVIGVLDSNATPEGVDYPIPGNDDSMRAIRLYLELASQTILAGIEKSVQQAGVDIGAMAEPQSEQAIETGVSEETPADPTTSVEDTVADEQPASPASSE